jgi:DNA gyrase subunit A
MVLGEVGMVRKIDIDQEMQQAYLDYAMSVIVARALPDARDGLKPVHRRILYAMHDMGLQPNTSYKKSARIVGEVLGKYHPHGEAAVYDAMARLVQDFSTRYPLVDGQGNFGSMDGDSPAAMRYTEAKLAALSANLLQDIAKNTVDFSDNFDGTLTEPDVLPSALPNLLLNGATGIAVGMATSIPPHNLIEVVDALIYMLKNWQKQDDISVDDLMQFIQGPDFPTGGIIIQEADGEGLAAAYGSGRGRITVQARAHFEQMDRGRNRIIVTELPYMTNKSALIERIANLVRDGKLEGITDLRDESDRHGMRIVIELTKNVDPEAILRDLYKNTPMQSTFSIIMLALVNGEPRLLSLKQALRVYLEHRHEIVRRRSEYDLDKAQKRAHILEGLRIALKNLDEVINLIRRSADVETARERLIKRYKLSQEQAQAILDMPLRRLASLERKKIEDEYKELTTLIKDLQALLRSAVKMRQVIAEELEYVKEEYGDRRRTQIVQLQHGATKASLLTATDLAPSQTVWVTITEDGLVGRVADGKQPRPSGTDVPYWLLQVNTRDILYLVSETGDTATVAVHALPELEKPSEGTSYAKLSALTSDDILATAFALPSDGELSENWYVLTVTRQGMVKKSSLSEVPGLSAKPFTLAKVNDGDRLAWVRLTNGSQEVLLGTSQGMAIRFSEDEIRPMGLVAAGVMGIKLQNRDEVIGVELLPDEGEVLLVTSDGRGKRVAQAQFPVQGRYGQGVIGWKLPGKTRLAGLTVGRGTTRVTVHLMKLSAKSLRLDEAPLQTRSARGGQVIELKTGDEVLGITVPHELPRPMDEHEAAPKKRASSRSSSGNSGAQSTQDAPAKPKTTRQTRSRSTSTTKSSGSTSSGSKSAVSKSSGSRTSGSRTSGSRTSGSRTTGSKPAASRTRTTSKPAPKTRSSSTSKTTTGKTSTSKTSTGRTKGTSSGSSTSRSKKTTDST